MNIKIIAKYITLALFILGGAPIMASEKATTKSIQTLAQQIDSTFGLAGVLGSYEASGKTMHDMLEFLFKLRMNSSFRSEIDEELRLLRESNAEFNPFPQFYFRILSDEEYRRLSVILQRDASTITALVNSIIPKVEQEILREKNLTVDQKRLNKILDGFVKFLVNLAVDDSISGLSAKCKPLIDRLLVDDEYAKLAYTRFKQNLNSNGYSFRCATMLYVLSQYLLSTKELRQEVVNAFSEVVNDRRGLSEEEVDVILYQLFGLSVDLGDSISVIDAFKFGEKIIQEARKGLSREKDTPLDHDAILQKHDETFERYKAMFDDLRQDIDSDYESTTASPRSGASGEDSDGSVVRRQPLSDREKERLSLLARENAARASGDNLNELPNKRDDKLLRELAETRRLIANVPARPMSRAGLGTSAGFRATTAQKPTPGGQQRTSSGQSGIDARHIKIN